MNANSNISLCPVSSDEEKMDTNRNREEQERKLERATKRIRFWKLLTVVTCALAIVLAALLLWKIAQSNTSDKSRTTQAPCKAKNETTLSSVQARCPRIPTVRPLTTPLPAELKGVFKELDILLSKMVDEKTSLPAISANVFYGQSLLWSGHFGSKFSNSTDNTKPNDNTVYRIGSVTKVFPVLLIYKLFEGGTIGSIDDPLNKYFPEFHIKNPFTNENITMREIICQMSGLPREAPCRYHCEETNSKEQLAQLQNKNLLFPPWKKPSYSNLGFALLGRLITENLLNTTFEKWVQGEILEPLKMNNTGFEITSMVEENLAFPYGHQGKRIPFSKLGWAAPAGGMYSSLNDLTKLGMMFTRPSNQTLFKPSTVRQMALPVDIAPDGLTLWGSPFEMVFSNGYLVRGKGGNIDSYDAYFSFVPELELGINILMSGRSISLSASEFGREAYTKLLPVLNRTLFNLEETTVFPIDSKAFTGWYIVNQTSFFTMEIFRYNATITERNGVLLFKGLSQVAYPFAIRYIGDSSTFQAEFLSPGMSCFTEIAGIFADIHFSPPTRDGLSQGFSLPQWGIVGLRIEEEH